MYYYNDTVRNIVDNDGEEDNTANEEMKEYLNQCQQYIAAMGVYADSLEDLTEDSVDKFSEFADGVATKTGGKASEDTEYGKSIAKLEIKNERFTQQEQVREKQHDMAYEDARYEKLENQIQHLTSLVESILTQGLPQGINKNVEQVTKSDIMETSTLVEDSEVAITEENVEEISEPVVTVQEEVAPTPVVEEPKPPVVEEPIIDTGFDDLLASAGINL
jgi:hypothetical protein